MIKTSLRQLFRGRNSSFVIHLIESGSSQLLLFTGEILEDVAIRHLYSIYQITFSKIVQKINLFTIIWESTLPD